MARYKTPFIVQPFTSHTGSNWYLNNGLITAGSVSLSSSGFTNSTVSGSSHFLTGKTSIKGVYSGSTYATWSATWDMGSDTGYDLRGCTMRLRFFASFDPAKKSLSPSTEQRGTIYFCATRPFSANYYRLNFSFRNGWNVLEFDLSNCSAQTGTPSLSAVKSIQFNFGANHTAWKMLTPGEYIILDSFEVWQTGRTKAGVIIQLDDALEEQYTHMAPYCAKYGFPVQVFVPGEAIGKTLGTFKYATWDQVIQGSKANVLSGVHSRAAIGLNVSDGQIKTWCRRQKNYLLDHGIIRGSDHMALPGGQLLSLRDQEALDVMAQYFVSVRGTAPWYQDAPAGFLGSVKSGSAVVCPKNYIWSAALGIDVDYATYIDEAIACKSVAILYTHGLKEVNSYWPTTTATFEACVDYINTKVAAGDLEVLTIEDICQDYNICPIASEHNQGLRTLQAKL